VWRSTVRIRFAPAALKRWRLHHLSGDAAMEVPRTAHMGRRITAAHGWHGFVGFGGRRTNVDGGALDDSSE